jgi:hypothetical protein
MVLACEILGIEEVVLFPKTLEINDPRNRFLRIIRKESKNKERYLE